MPGIYGPQMGGFGASPMGMPAEMGLDNPFMQLIAGLSAANNPQPAANAFAAAGMPPPAVEGFAGPPGTDFGALLLGGDAMGAFPSGPTAALGGSLDISSLMQGAPGAGGGVPGAGGGMPGAGAAGFKNPVDENKPIMNAGVSGAQKAPDSNATLAAGGGGMLQLIQQLLGPSPAQQPIKPLGMYL